jgi:hypothetical protein
MSIHLPKSFTKFTDDPTTKAAFFSMNEAQHPRDCRNCGGLGVIYLFVAKGGPFREVPNGKNIIAHWTKQGWWAGTNEAGACPDCGGTGINPGYIELETKQRHLDMNIGKGVKNVGTRKDQENISG